MLHPSDDQSESRAYLTAYVRERHMAPTSDWTPAEGTFSVLSNPPTGEPVRLYVGNLRLTEIRTPFERLAVEALSIDDLVLSTLYVNEPYLTKEDQTPLADGLVEISSDLYAKFPCRDSGVEAMADNFRQYFVTWSFLMLRSVANVRDIVELFARADMIAIGAPDGEGFVIWKRGTDARSLL